MIKGAAKASRGLSLVREGGTCVKVCLHAEIEEHGITALIELFRDPHQANRHLNSQESSRQCTNVGSELDEAHETVANDASFSRAYSGLRSPFPSCLRSILLPLAFSMANALTRGGHERCESGTGQPFRNLKGRRVIPSLADLPTGTLLNRPTSLLSHFHRLSAFSEPICPY